MLPRLFTTPECELVATLSRVGLVTALEERACAIVHSGIDWDRTFRIAEHWEVEPVFFSSLARLNCVPADVMELAKSRAMRARSRATAVALWTTNLLKRIEDEGVPCILLKGAAIGVVAYDDPSFRTSADADILVSNDDLRRVHAMLESWGFVPTFKKDDISMLINNGHALEFMNESRKVELHVTLLSDYLCLELPVADLWTSAITIQVAGHRVRTLDRVSFFIYLCAHGAKHEWQRFRWVCDVGRLGEKLTENEALRVEEIAGQLHARRIILLAIEIARSLTGANMPALSARNFGDRDKIASLVTRAARHFEDLAHKPPSPGREDFESRFEGLKYWMQARERMRDRVRVVACAFFAPVRGSGARLPSSILRRSSRLVSLAFRRSLT